MHRCITLAVALTSLSSLALGCSGPTPETERVEGVVQEPPPPVQPAEPSGADGSPAPLESGDATSVETSPSDASLSDAPSSDASLSDAPSSDAPPPAVEDSASPAAEDSASPAVDAWTPDPPPPPPGCGVAPAEPPPMPGPYTSPGDHPMIRHWEVPRASNVVALTFDDGPDPATTNRILDTLEAEGIRATFFLNSRTTFALRTSSEAQKTIARMVAAGHVLGNHTAEHLNLTLVSTDVEAQLRMVEDDLKVAFPCAAPLTLVRAPYGQPYLSGSEEAQARVYPIVARHGVHVGWSIESLDWTCSQPSCVTDRVLYRIDLGRRGPILLHDTQVVTADALPTLIAELKKRGVGFVTAERLVRDKYGRPSAELKVP